MAKDITIETLEKAKSGYVMTYDGHTMTIDPMTIMKHQLKVGMTIDQKTFIQVKKDRDVVYYDQLAIKKLKKMLTTKELYDFLIEAGCPKDIVNTLIKKYISHKYLDDLAYAKAYISSKQYRQGPQVMIEKLKDKGITDEVIKHAWGNYDAKDILYTLIEKKVKSTKNKSLKQLKSQLFGHYVAQGFAMDLVKEVLEDAQAWYQADTDQLIEKHFIKAYHKALKTLEPNEAYYKALQSLYQKGFDMQHVKEITQTVFESIQNEEEALN